MTVIKIIRSSIKLNPEAGKQVSRVAGPRSATFEYEGKFPKEFEKRVVITSEKLDGSYCEGHVINPDDAADLMLDIARKYPGKRISIAVNNSYISVDHFPEGRWLYKYRNPDIRCENCGSSVRLGKIDFDYGNDGERATLCPICNGINSFGEIVFEDINSVIDYRDRQKKRNGMYKKVKILRNAKT